MFSSMQECSSPLTHFELRNTHPCSTRLCPHHPNTVRMCCLIPLMKSNAFMSDQTTIHTSLLFLLDQGCSARPLIFEPGIRESRDRFCSAEIQPLWRRHIFKSRSVRCAYATLSTACRERLQCALPLFLP